MRCCLDTSAYSNFKRGDPQVTDLIDEASWVGLPAIVLGELRTGFALGTKRRDNERALADFMSHEVVEVLAVDDDASRIYAEIVVDLRRAGTPIPTNDIWIAALAVREGATVITYDSHFEKIRRAGHHILQVGLRYPPYIGHSLALQSTPLPQLGPGTSLGPLLTRSIHHKHPLLSLTKLDRCCLHWLSSRNIRKPLPLPRALVELEHQPVARTAFAVDLHGLLGFDSDPLDESCGREPDRAISYRCDLHGTRLPTRDACFRHAKQLGKFCRRQPEQLTDEADLRAAQPRRAVDDGLKHQAVQLAEPGEALCLFAAVAAATDLDTMQEHVHTASIINERLVVAAHPVLAALVAPHRRTLHVVIMWSSVSLMNASTT